MWCTTTVPGSYPRAGASCGVLLLYLVPAPEWVPHVVYYYSTWFLPQSGCLMWCTTWFLPQSGCLMWVYYCTWFLPQSGCLMWCTTTVPGPLSRVGASCGVLLLYLVPAPEWVPHVVYYYSTWFLPQSGCLMWCTTTVSGSCPRAGASWCWRWGWSRRVRGTPCTARGGGCGCTRRASHTTSRCSSRTAPHD